MQRESIEGGRTPRRALLMALAVCAAAVPVLAVSPGAGSAAAGAGTVSGEVERIFLNSPGDVYAGGQLVVGGQNIIIPRNLLLDLPANRLTLQQLFVQAPPACLAVGETGLAKGDTCNPSHTGAIVTISANRVASGDVIAGDVLLEKGVEAVTGNVTYINFTDGYFRVNGRANDPTTGVMVRINDPDSRHTVQQGLGCAAGAFNCSPDPRFTLDGDNYTNVFTSGYPLCIPSTLPRPASTADVALASLGANPGANASGIGDVFCPSSNRGNRVAADSRRMAPLQLGDPITAEGNFETVNGVQFLSAHSTTVSFGLQTSGAVDQPDYMFLEEAFIDVAGFQNQRARALFIGFATNPNPDILGWSLHYDPQENKAHEMPLASTNGCNAAGGGCTGFGTGLFKIRYDTDFLAQPTSPKLSVCSHLNAEPRFGTAFCPGGNSASNEFSILSPVPHEIQFRTGKKVANPNLMSIDISGAESTNGQYLFPFGANLGGINFPEALEFNLDLANQPFSFEGIPWNLDRRLGPGGCQTPDANSVETCESTPQPLIPFPYSEQDPRNLAGGAIVAGGDVPTAPYNDPAFTSAPLSSTANRIFSFIPTAAATKFAGDASVLSFPPPVPVAQGITPTPLLTQSGPAVLGIDPASGQIGTTVHIGGLGLKGATGVSINGTTALFNVINDARIDVTVPAAATTGLISVQLPSGSVSSPTAFTVVANPLAPNITSFSPATGDEGSTVTITGVNFNGTTSVLFGTTPASTFVVNPAGTSITATVPLGIGAGARTITVNTANGTAPSATTFGVTVPPPPPPAAPTVTTLTPSHAQVGSAVTITGTGFVGATAVKFNGVNQPTFTVVNATTIQTTVPASATTGAVSVTNATGTSTVTATFTVDALVSPVANVGPSPISVAQGSLVTLNGSASTGATTYSWTQIGTPAVTISGANAAVATFTMPNLFVTLKFRLTVTNAAGTSSKDVTISSIAGIVTVDAGTQFRTSKGEWRATGTASFPGANTVTIRTGNIVGSGNVIGTAAVDAVGVWTLNVRNSPVGASTFINVTSTRGGSAVGTVTVRT